LLSLARFEGAASAVNNNAIIIIAVCTLSNFSIIIDRPPHEALEL